MTVSSPIRLPWRAPRWRSPRASAQARIRWVYQRRTAITGSYNATTGVLTLTGTASIADYQAALRAVKFATSDSSASPAARTVSFTVTDSAAATSAAAARTIDVSQAEAQAPTAVGQSYTAVGNTPLGSARRPPGRAPPSAAPC